MKTILLVLAAFLTGNVIQAEENEKILGVTTGQKGITYQVYSGGCTTKEHFEILIAESHPMQLTLVRKSPDLCHAYIPYGELITWSWEEIGFQRGDQFTISNQMRTLQVSGIH